MIYLEGKVVRTKGREERKREEGKGGKRKKFFFKIFTQVNEYYSSEYKVTNDPGAQNSGNFLKTHSKHEMSPDSWQSDTQTPEPRRASPGPWTILYNTSCQQSCSRLSVPIKPQLLFQTTERSVCCVFYKILLSPWLIVPRY